MEDETGYHFMYDSVEDLRRVIVRYMDGLGNRNEMERSVFDEYKRKFSQTVNYNLLVDIYDYVKRVS